MIKKNAPVQVPHHGHLPHGLRLRVPWRIHEKAWQRYHQDHREQSAEQLAERGGFSLGDLIYLLAGESPYEAKNDDPMASGFFGKFDEK